METQLTPRQREILQRVVEDYVATGQPVGSKHLVEHSQLSVSSSTVRSELAELEGLGLLERSRDGGAETLILTARGRFLGGGVTAELLP